ncbi:MAG: hypothetical protein KF893_01430 [Caldilineaceae bacterium]|nr:hypothetical protein [Caldilineaceae bacterium]
MSAIDLEPCPGCGAHLPPSDGPTHRYIGASATCWAIFSNLLNAGEPPLIPSPWNNLLVDAYAAQHPGTPSAQAIQSVAIHLITLYGVFERGVSAGDTLWIRQRALRHKAAQHNQFHWLTPPLLEGSLTVAEIVQLPTPAARTAQVRAYVEQVWAIWSHDYRATVEDWYNRLVAPERL